MSDGGSLRTVRIIARLNIGGPARHTTLLDAGLRGRGYETLLVHGVPEKGEGSLEHLVTELGIPARRLDRLGRAVRPFDDVRTLRQIVRLLRDVSPDVVHTHTAKAGALGRVAAAIHNSVRSRSARAVVVHTFHGHVLEGYFSPAVTRAVRWAERGLALVTDRIVAISPAQHDDLVHRFRVAPGRKVVVVPLGLDLARLVAMPRTGAGRESFGLEPEAFVIGFAGRFVPIKNLPLLLEAFATLHATVPRARLLLAGDGPLREAVVRLAASLGIERAVHLVGWIQDLSAFFQACDVVALTSDNEGTPVVLIEAMAASCAVVATRAGGVVDLVDDGVNGRLVSRGDAASFSRVLAELAGAPDTARRLGARARADVAARFGVDRLVNDVDRLYRDLVRRRGN